MRAADECHPLPDQLHPCSWFSWFCSDSILQPNLQPERSMRFTTPSIASAGESVFAFEKYSFPKPDVPTPLLFRHPPLRFDSIFSNGYRSCSFSYFPKSCDFGFLIRAPHAPASFEAGCLAERRVEIDLLELPWRRRERSNPKPGSLDARLELPSCFRVIGFAGRSPEKTCAVSLAAVSECKTLSRCFGVATPS